MIKIILKIIIGILIFLVNVNTYTTQPPVWSRNTNFRAGSLIFINNNVNSAKIITFTFTYTSILSGIPRIAYGFKNHIGYDYRLNFQNYDLRRTSISASALTLTFQLYNSMRVYKIEICYFAIDPSLTQHINAFDNVDLNYTSGTLTTFNTQQSITVAHVQTINYTNQANGLTFKTFTDPISSNKIALYQNSLYINVYYYSNVNIITSWAIVNSSHYQIRVTVLQNINLYRFRFSIIVFNQESAQSSKKYDTVYQYLSISSQVYRALQPVVTDNFMLGLLDFQSYHSYSGYSGIEWSWDFKTNNRAGVPFQVTIWTYLFQSVAGYYGLSWARGYIFYIKTWLCNSTTHIYYNLTTNLCQDGCSEYFYQNLNDKWCDKCYYACQQCSVGSLTNESTCVTCQAALNRIKINSSCVCSTGYFDDFYSPGCRLCTSVDPKCVRCSYPYNSSKNSNQYRSIFNATNWSFDILPTFICTQCATNYFYNSTSRLCETCNIPNCTVCLNLTACSVCNTAALTIKYTNNMCYVCNITRCMLCSSNNVCVQCPAGSDLVSNQCPTCNVSCTCDGYTFPKINGTCSEICGDSLIVGNQQCDDSNNISHDGCSNLCKIEECNQSCSCDGWVAPWVTSNNSCSTRCGDGIKRGIQQCDDGNTLDHDNCSSICKIQPCHISCTCDGWTHPYLQNQKMCSSICGDGILRGSQQCDDNNSKNNDGCTFLCKIQKVFLKQGSTIVPSLIIFFISIRIAGIQVLNVLQNFQLLLKVYNIETFQISYLIHGFSSNNAFIFQISEKNYFLKRFNFMFLLIVIIFLITILVQFAAFLFTRKSKRKGVLQLKLKDKKIKQQVKSSQQQSSQIESSNQQNQTDSNQQQNTQNQSQQNQQQFKKQKKEPPKIRRFIVFRKFLRQVSFDMVINCLSIFFFGLAYQIKQNDYNQLLDPGSLFSIICMPLLLIASLIIFYKDGSMFGQNQLKFKNNKAMRYWIIVILQKIIFSIVVNFKMIQVLYGMLAFKGLIFLIFLFGKIYNKTNQLVRCLIVHFLHIVLIGLFTLFQLYSNDNSQTINSLINKIGYLYFTFIGILLLIMFAFYIRQIINSCSSDYRYQQEQLYQQTQETQQQQSQKSPKKTIKDQKTLMQMTGQSLIKHQIINFPMQQQQKLSTINHNNNKKPNKNKPQFKIQKEEQQSENNHRSVQQISIDQNYNQNNKSSRKQQLLSRIKSRKAMKNTFMNQQKINNKNILDIEERTPPNQHHQINKDQKFTKTKQKFKKRKHGKKLDNNDDDQQDIRSKAVYNKRTQRDMKYKDDNNDKKIDQSDFQRQ